MKITLKKRVNASGELERTFISFKSKCQKPLIMIIKEYWFGGKVVWADVIKSIG